MRPDLTYREILLPLFTSRAYILLATFLPIRALTFYDELESAIDGNSAHRIFRDGRDAFQGRGLYA